METKKTHWKRLINLDYIGAYSLEDGKDLNITIEKVVRELVTGNGGKKEECTVAYLRGQKPFIINRTNGKMIQKILGTPFIEDWQGKTVTVYATTTKVAGEEVECLRVRPVLPKIDRTKDEARMKACMTVQQLAEVWKVVGCPELENLKNQLKDELSKNTTTNA